MYKMSLLNLNLLFISTNNLILQATVALCLSLTLSFFKIPALFLHGLHTYIHPDDVNPPTGGGVRAAIRRPGAAPDPELKPRKRSKDKLEFDESKAQIFRLRLTDGHLQSRLYFASFHSVFNSVVIALSCLCLHNSLPVSEASSGFISNGSIVPILLGLAGSCRVLLLIARVSFERSASKKSEKLLSLISGLLGFALGLLVLLEILPTRVFDFGFGSLDGFGKFLVSVFMGCVAGFLVTPAARSARAFWLGTDQIRCNLSIIYCGWIARVLLYANYLLIIFTSLLWITPFANLLVNKHADDSGGSHLLGKADVLVGNVGMSKSDFDKFRTWCLLVSGLLQIAILRPSLQMYLNEAVLSWYQRLHASKVPDLDFSRAKVFLHNHYLCLVVLQFFAPPALVLLFLGLSQIDENLLNNFQPVCSFLHCSALVKQVPLFMAWWITFVWAVLTSANLVLYRHGILYVS
ncbi:uncharacterized protein LOC127796374 [Diospyros lotus]|uniref:uncharacterized protein LOC127796374 n=1 Tax=Diospyros lotus TaxID=55363 RepID=UPI00225A2461|nr:uncharacterized protein LOC127796374 [Diospyros lotus]